MGHHAHAHPPRTKPRLTAPRPARTWSIGALLGLAASCGSEAASEPRDSTAALDRLIAVLNAAGPTPIGSQRYLREVLGVREIPADVPAQPAFMFCPVSAVYFCDMQDAQARALAILASLGFDADAGPIREDSMEVAVRGSDLRSVLAWAPPGPITGLVPGDRLGHRRLAPAPPLGAVNSLYGFRPEPTSCFEYLVSLAEYLDSERADLEVPLEPLGSDTAVMARCPEPVVTQLGDGRVEARYHFPAGTAYFDGTEGFRWSERGSSDIQRTGVMLVGVLHQSYPDRLALRLEQGGDQPLRVGANGPYVVAPPRFDPTRTFDLVCVLADELTGLPHALVIHGAGLGAAEVSAAGL